MQRHSSHTAAHVNAKAAPARTKRPTPAWFRTWMQRFATSGDLGLALRAEQVTGSRFRLPVFFAPDSLAALVEKGIR